MQVGKIAGVKFKFNLVFLILCALYIMLGMGLEILVIVASVIVHEIAHTIMGLALGIKVEEIELLPFGGQAKLQDFTGLEPNKEIYVALAGPLISLSMAAFFYFLDFEGKHDLIPFFVNINLLLGVFNLLPALPLDGGRILRSFLSSKQGFRRATSISTIIGKVLAVIICFYGIYLTYQSKTGANFIFIAILLYWAANREKKLLVFAFMRYLVNKKGVLSSKGFVGGEQVVSKMNTLVKDILHNSRPMSYMLVFIVDNNDNVISIKSEAELIEALLQKGSNITLKDCLKH